MKQIFSPKEFFGFTPGDDYELAHWDRIVEYFEHLDAVSDRVLVENMGPSTEGRPFLKATFSSPANLARLNELRRISMTLADPRGLSDAEIDKLASEGKAVCVQTMSLHGNEIGGTQMSVNLAYDLVTATDEDTLRILDEVVFILVPCFNPDGQAQIVEWYYETKGTEFEGSDSPELFHKYAGHDNNRDAVYQNLIESKYVADILFHEWMPQSYQDHHHMGSYGARMEIAPYKDPIRQYTAPHIWRELTWYGASIGRAMEEKGLIGVSNGSVYPGWQHFGFYCLANQHNITGLLTETATAKMATPKYVDPTQIKGNGYAKEAHTNYPSPWNGGWWHLRDVTDRQYTAAYSLLDTMARNRKTVLRDMAIKALYQTECGEKRSEVAYIIPENQHDTGEVKHLIRVLLGQNIEVHRAVAPFAVGNTEYPAGTYVVYLAQPKYGVVANLLGQTRFPVNRWTKNPTTGAVNGYDTFTDTVNEFMGVEAIPAGMPFTGNFEKISAVQETYTVQKGGKVILSASENSAYKPVNLMLKAGVSVYRVDNENHDFYAEGDAETIAGILQEAPTPHVAVEEAPEKLLSRVEKLKVGVFHRYYYGNTTEGWTRFVLEECGFDYDSVYAADVCAGLEGYDVLIMSHDTLAFILGLADSPASAINGWVQWLTEFGGPHPEKYRKGIGKNGFAEIKKFVERGGRLLAFNRTATYVIDYLGINVRNVVKGLPANAYNAHGSTLHVEVDTKDPACYGMPKKAYILNYSSPTFAVTDTFDADRYSVSMRYPEKDLLRSGYLVGEDVMRSKGALVTCRMGKGEVVLYGYEPQWRGQITGVFKTFLNKLYK